MGLLDHIVKNKHKYILLFIFLLAFSFRLFYAFQSNYVEYDSYFELRQVDNIKSNYLPLIEDDLSYSGRDIISTPLYNYFLAFFNLFLPLTLVAKILPNLLISMFVFVVYLISNHLTKNKNISLLTAFISVFVPILFGSSLYTLSAQPITLLLILYSLYCLMRINDSERFVNLFLIIIILLPLVHGTSLLLVVGLLFYLFLTKIEGFNIKKSETEIILFSTFFIAWTLFLIFKKAILMHGPAVIWQNLPESILNLKFATTNILNYFNYIGIIPLIFGIWSVHRHVIKTRDIDSYKLISFVVSIFLLLILKLVEPTLALSYIGIILVIISSKIFLHISEYIKKTKAPRFRFFIFSFIIFLFIFTSLITTIDLSEGKITNLPSQNEINALEWLKTQGKEGEVVLASLKYGHAINYVAKKRNVFDNNFISMDNVETKMKDVKYLYHSKSLIEVVRLINKYDIKYIILSKQEKKDYKIEDLSYKNNHICFKLIYDKDQIKIYEFLDCDTGQDDE